MTLPFPHIILVHFYIRPIFRQKRCASCRNRYRNRNVRNRRRLNNARDENRYRSRGSNNDNRNRDQPSRQGFGFENNFWTDGDANDFFRFVYFLILCILKKQDWNVFQSHRFWEYWKILQNCPSNFPSNCPSNFAETTLRLSTKLSTKLSTEDCLVLLAINCWFYSNCQTRLQKLRTTLKEVALASAT